MRIDNEMRRAVARFVFLVAIPMLVQPMIPNQPELLWPLVGLCAVFAIGIMLWGTNREKATGGVMLVPIVIMVVGFSIYSIGSVMLYRSLHPPSRESPPAPTAPPAAPASPPVKDDKSSAGNLTTSTNQSGGVTSSGNVTSHNQSGGQTAQTIVNNFPSPNQTPHRVIDKTDTFIFSIPVMDAGNITCIPMDTNPNDPLRDAYLQLASIAQFPFQEFITNRQPTEQEISDYLVKVVQYYVLRAVFDMQDPSTTYIVDSQMGIKATMPSPVDVPDAEEYPKERLVVVIKSLNLLDLNGFIYRNDHWLPRLPKLPRGTDISFATLDGINGESPSQYIVRFKKYPELNLDFSVQRTAIVRGSFPRNFVLGPGWQIRAIYTFNFAMKLRFHWNGDRDKGEDYKEWGLGLFLGLKKRLSQPD